MGKFILLVTVLCTMYNLVEVSNALNCYTCGHVETGEPVIGYEVDESCKWGNKPNEKFLQSCKTEEDDTGDNRFEFVCIQLRIEGYLQDKSDNRLQINTQRGCAARFNTTSTKAQVKECRQGTISELLQKSDNLVGKEYLEGVKGIYDDIQVKFCTCDDDDNGCSHTDEDIVKEDDDNDGDGQGQGNADNSSSLNVKITFTHVLIAVIVLIMRNF